MRNWVNQNAAPQQVDVLLFEAFSNHCLANTVEPLRAANGFAAREVYRWRFLSLEGGLVASSSGMPVATHGKLSDASGDILIVMPSYRFAEHATTATGRALRAAAGRYSVIAGFDTGSWLLASARLLDGRQATIHWEVLERFAEAFPDVEALRERHVIDGNRITCSGALAAFELIMELIGERHGQALRLEVATLFMAPEATGGQGAQEGVLARSRTVARAVAVMQENIEAPLTIARIARAVGRSQKDLEARMRAQLGATPQAVYRRLRLIQARKLVLESDMAVAEIALRCGYQDASAMTRAFREEFGDTPRGLRRG
ncbi:GlxA family transcriptional regulator [Alisedimentitalea sp. MJ-SS2]|uniref:GlxA family transcriptional regulator n=1 Tax=Aliisedimentitalea sp. MJ-SS2 TaxID=3049795 RepID=UPI00290EA310|nr:GlxA family transcriptional regulator [Alisedimentitalea sp. MJ-SS2]MDU8927721.1 GlxA family transcriptional regulator [Alisedimentitalea sp. MJ-SS2]